nr:beta-L-arabinofuranosidase domain-containing protein [Tessaracoccus coleopterorum]
MRAPRDRGGSRRTVPRDGDARYLEQARVFIDRRGHGLLADIEWGRSYYQDDEPFRTSTVLRGHAVRALYLAASAVDVAVESGDTELFDAARRQYDNALARRTYVTGGMGSHHQDEAFGEDFELPPDRSYCETCAGVGSIMVAWRLLLSTGDLRYGDAIERTLYNIVAASPPRTAGRSSTRTRCTAAPPPRRLPPTGRCRGPTPRCAHPGSTCPAAPRTCRAPWPAWPAIWRRRPRWRGAGAVRSRHAQRRRCPAAGRDGVPV